MGNGIAHGRTGLPVRGATTTTGMGFAIGGRSGAEKRGPLLQAAGSRQSLVYSSWLKLSCFASCLILAVATVFVSLPVPCCRAQEAQTTKGAVQCLSKLCGLSQLAQALRYYSEESQGSRTNYSFAWGCAQTDN